ncbi:hypothetical protein Lser_V15G23243 [Lactuca serriola]
MRLRLMAIIEEREIQNQIGEINEIFKDLAVMVHEKRAMIEFSCYNCISKNPTFRNSSKVTEAVRSRCLNVQISAPKKTRVLEFIGKKELRSVLHFFLWFLVSSSYDQLRPSQWSIMVYKNVQRSNPKREISED